MANNYLEFSEVLPRLTTEEVSWLQEQLEIVYIIDGKEYTEEELPKGKSTGTADATWTGCRAYRDMEDFDPDWGDGVGFLYSFSDPDKPDTEWGRYLWIYSEEHGNVDCVSHVVQKFLKKFRPDECWSLTYATTCSKPRVGEFGGGALFVTASDIKWQNAYDFVEQEKSREESREGRLTEGTRIVLNVSGGVVQDVFCSDPQADVVLVDWDTDGCDPDTPGLVEVAGSGIAYVTGWDAESLDTMEATDVGAALKAWKREPGAPR